MKRLAGVGDEEISGLVCGDASWSVEPGVVDGTVDASRDSVESGEGHSAVDGVFAVGVEFDSADTVCVHDVHIPIW